MTAHHDSCPFCARIAAGDVETTAVPDVVTFEPLRAVTAGHRLFVPRQHVADWRRGDGPLLLSEAMLAAGLWAQALLPTAQPFEGANLIVSAGRSATQTVRHMHVHLVPRMPDDGLQLPWTGQA